MQGDACFMKISYFNWKVNEKRDRNNMVLLEYVFLNTLFLKVKKQRRLLSQKKKKIKKKLVFVQDAGVFEPLESNKSIHLVKDLYRVQFSQEFDNKTMLLKQMNYSL